MNAQTKTVATVDHVADWHGIQAIRHYNKGNMAEFRRHCKIADERWAACGAKGKEQLSRLQNAHNHDHAPHNRKKQTIAVLVNGKPVFSK